MSQNKAVQVYEGGGIEPDSGTWCLRLRVEGYKIEDKRLILVQPNIDALNLLEQLKEEIKTRRTSVPCSFKIYKEDNYSYKVIMPRLVVKVITNRVSPETVVVSW